jgi:hypothetical protein
MKLQIDNEDIWELLPWQEAVIKNDILEEEFVDHMKRIARWVWEHKFEQCFKRFRQEWEPRLITEGAQTLPTSQEAFANLVFSHPDYKNRSAREAERQ